MFEKKIQRNSWLFLSSCLMINLFTFYLMIALVSFSDLDPSWSHATKNEVIYNLCGIIGAWLADILFITFGFLAYVIPSMILFIFWKTYLQLKRIYYVDFFTLSLRLIGSLLLLCSFCGLITFNISNCYHSDVGGLVGNLLNYFVLSFLDSTYLNLVMMCMILIGIMLLIDVF